RVRELQATLDARRAELRKDLAARYRQRLKAEHGAKVTALETELAGLVNQERAQKAEVATLTTEVQKLGKSTGDVENLKAEIDNERAIVGGVHKDLELAKYELQAKPRVTVPQEAALLPR